MATITLEEIATGLEGQRKSLQANADKLSGELQAVQEDIHRITAAIEALSGKQGTASGKKTQKRKKSSKPAANKSQVIKEMFDVLTDDVVLAVDDLKQMVEARLTRAGFSRMGLSLRLKEALADEQFIDSPGGVRLASAEETVASA